MSGHLWIVYRHEFVPFSAAITRWICHLCRVEATSWAERNTLDDLDGCWSVPEEAA